MDAISNARNKKEQETIAKFVAADTLNAVSSMVDEQQDAGKGEIQANYSEGFF